MSEMKVEHESRISIKLKLTMLLLMIGIIPAVVIGVLSIIKSRTVLHNAAINQLVSIREMKKERIEDYFSTIANQILTFSSSRMMVNAMNEFSKSFFMIKEEKNEQFINKREMLLQRLRDRYNYQLKNTPGADPNAVSKWFPTEDISLILQTAYISENENPINNKHKLDSHNDHSLYSNVHKIYHPILRDFQAKFGYYDIFLVEPETGYVVYSVFKELDFATSLLSGPYRNTNFAKSFSDARNASDKDSVVLVDFEQYEPSYNRPASFIASPIYDGNKKVGILVFQMPIDKINDIMTSKRKWANIGLGKTGTTNIVAADFTLRNNSRFLIEDKEGFIKTLKKAGASKESFEIIESSGTTILFQKDRNGGTEAAIQGETGFGIFVDYLGYDVISAYAPLDIKGVNWAIVAEIDKREALADSGRLTWWIGIIVAVVAAVSILVGRPVIRSIVVSIMIVADKLKELASDEADLRKRIPIEGNDEIGQLSHNFNTLMHKLMDLVKQVQKSSIQLSSTSTQIAASSNELEATATEQAASTNEVVATSKEISGTTIELVNTMKEVTGIAVETATFADLGQKSLGDMEKIMQQLLEATESISSKLSVINDKTNNINSVVTTITKIADQTNLLSLNAAIEAEKAGEYGLGFSVVAKEVRRLADQTAVATLDIEQMVKSMQSAVSSGVMEMDKFSKKAVDGFDEVAKLSEQLTKIIELVQILTPRFESVNEGMQSQSEAAQQITESMVQVDESVQQITTSLRDFNKSTENLNSAAHGLRKEVLRFKV